MSVVFADRDSSLESAEGIFQSIGRERSSKGRAAEGSVQAIGRKGSLSQSLPSSLSSQHRSRSPDSSTQEKRLLSGEEASAALRSELSVATSALVSDRLFVSCD